MSNNSLSFFAERRRLDSISNQATGLGTSEDAAMYGRPTLGNRLTEPELMVLYLNSALAQRIIGEVVDDALRQGYIVKDRETGEPVLEPGEDAEDDGDEDLLHIEPLIADVWKDARLFGNAAILMVHDAVDLSTPLDPEAGAPTALVDLSRDEFSIYSFDYDPKTPNYRKPLLYNVSPSDSGEGLQGVLVHYSRLLVFRGRPLPRRIRKYLGHYDDSILQAVYDRIRNFEQTELAMGNIVQRFEIATYSVPGLGEMLDNPDGQNKLLQRLQLLQRTASMVRAIVIDEEAGEKYTRSFTAVNGLDTIWDRLAHSVAKDAEMPMTQLFGMSPSGLATDDESGRANWRKKVRSEQNRSLKSNLERYYRLLNDGKPVVVEFNPLDESTAIEAATIEKTRAETRDIYIASGCAAPDEFRAGMVREGVIPSEERPEPPPIPEGEGDPDAGGVDEENMFDEEPPDESALDEEAADEEPSKA